MANGVPRHQFGRPLAALRRAVGLPTYRLTIGEDGIELRQRRRTIVVPWTDVEYWWLGFPSTAAGRRKGSAGRLCLLAKPAAQVSDPAAGPRRTIWVDGWQRWVICEPALTDEKPNEIATAMRHFAGQLEAHVVRANAPVGSAVHALGEVDSDVHTTVGPTTIYPPKIANATGIGLLIGAFVTILVLNVPSVNLVFLALLAVAVLSFAEAGYLWWHWRQHRTMTVMAHGIELRTRRHAVTIPWTDVEYWTVGTGSRLSTTFFMGAKNAPNPAVRTAVRDVVLATPAEHVNDPATGPLRSSWSRRRQAWVLCKVTHTNATTGEIVALLRQFSAEKERSAVNDRLHARGESPAK